MIWFRHNRFSIASLAFFALAYQIVLSFGHIHLDKAVRDSISFAVANFPTAPPQDTPPVGQDTCAICATISQASTLVNPAPPTVAVPTWTPVKSAWAPAESRSALLLPAPFDARGPPSA